MRHLLRWSSLKLIEPPHSNTCSNARVKTRHVWVLPVYGVGFPKQGLVLAWRQVPRRASPPAWQAQTVYIDASGVTRIEWLGREYLEPVHSDRPIG
jgi:hypothetical protein